MHGYARRNGGGSRAWQACGLPARLGNRPTLVNGCPQRIPDRHSGDLFVGVRVEGFERQSAFHLRNGRRPHSQNNAATATIAAVVHVESAGSEPCRLDRCLNPEHADVAKVDDADAAGTV
jgi:hypothetical protein